MILAQPLSYEDWSDKAKDEAGGFPKPGNAARAGIRKLTEVLRQAEGEEAAVACLAGHARTQHMRATGWGAR